ncbi:hypothetical protein N2152v2_004294 [Parachlorella kessleri]
MRPYILQALLAQLVNPSETANDSHVNLWWTDNGQRAGSFNGHNGAVWTVDISYDSSTLLTGAGDATARLWSMHSGEELFRFRFHEPCRAAKFAVGEHMAALTTDPFMNEVSAIRIVNIAADPAEQSAEVVRSMTGPRGRIARVEWLDENRVLLSASEDGFVRRWDVETGKCVLERQIHEKHIMDLQTLEVMKTYQSTVPVNSAALSPIFDHVLIGGGQEASQVTTTSSRAGRFEARFFHKIYLDEFANVKGHFGPINAVAFSPDGTMFATGGEEGYVRLHHFDADYFSLKL